MFLKALNFERARVFFTIYADSEGIAAARCSFTSLQPEPEAFVHSALDMFCVIIPCSDVRMPVYVHL